MKVGIRLASSRGAVGRVVMEISFPRNSDSEAIKKTIEKYTLQVKEKYKFSRVEVQRLESKKILVTCSIKRLLDDKETLTEELFLSYLTNLGFVSLKTIQEVEQTEKMQISKIFDEINEKNTDIEWFKHFKSRKVIVKKSDIKLFVNKLLYVRGEIEQLSYLDEERRQSWCDKIEEIDFLTDNLGEFISDAKITYLINKSVKDRLLYYSDFYDNVKASKKQTQVI